MTDYKAIIERIVESFQENLSDWEIEFISSVYTWHILRDLPLSEKQEEIIIKINRKMMRG